MPDIENLAANLLGAEIDHAEPFRCPDEVAHFPRGAARGRAGGIEERIEDDAEILDPRDEEGNHVDGEPLKGDVKLIRQEAELILERLRHRGESRIGRAGRLIQGIENFLIPIERVPGEHKSRSRGADIREELRQDIELTIGQFVDFLEQSRETFLRDRRHIERDSELFEFLPLLIGLIDERQEKAVKRRRRLLRVDPGKRHRSHPGRQLFERHAGERRRRRRGADRRRDIFESEFPESDRLEQHVGHARCLIGFEAESVQDRCHRVDRCRRIGQAGDGGLARGLEHEQGVARIRDPGRENLIGAGAELLRRLRDIAGELQDSFAELRNRFGAALRDRRDFGHRSFKRSHRRDDRSQDEEAAEDADESPDRAPEPRGRSIRQRRRAGEIAEESPRRPRLFAGSIDRAGKLAHRLISADAAADVQIEKELVNPCRNRSISPSHRRQNGRQAAKSARLSLGTGSPLSLHSRRAFEP